MNFADLAIIDMGRQQEMTPLERHKRMGHQDKPVSEPTNQAEPLSAFGRAQAELKRINESAAECGSAVMWLASADAKDAARYRWLRENGSCNEKRGYGAVIDAYSNPSKRIIAFRYWCDAEELDAAIDAAMKG